MTVAALGAAERPELRPALPRRAAAGARRARLLPHVRAGLGAVWDSISTSDAKHAFWLTIKIAAIAVPLNTVFGVLLALLLARRQFRGKALINAIIDLPFAISPVVVGLSLLLVYGINEPIGGWLSDHGIRVIFAMPGMVLATIFVCAPVRRP